MIVTVKEMKNYLRVDFEDDDRLLSDLIEQGQQICMDVARIADEDEFEEMQGTKIAVQYAVAYLYEHREDADHHQLMMDLRSLLFGVRKPGLEIIGMSGLRITVVLLRSAARGLPVPGKRNLPGLWWRMWE